MKLMVLVTALFLASFTVNAAKRVSIVEDNDLYIGVDEKSASSMTEKQFNDTLSRLEKIFAPIVKKKGGKLQIIRKWSDGTVNAYAQQSGGTWKVTMFGGLARHATITQDAFALVGCHELGHHMGGVPKKGGWFGRWASAEGQSDYYGTLKCMKRYASMDDNLKIVSRMKINSIAKNKCKKVFADPEDAAICMRSAMAGLSLGKLFEVLKKLTVPITFETPDTTVIKKTNSGGYPPVQCRFDTYFAGALCDVAVSDDVSNSDVNKGVCTRSGGRAYGARPLCWYKP